MSRPKPTVLLSIVGINVLLFFFLLVFIEGALSWVYVIKDIRATGSIAEELHTTFDPLLGWVNIPGTSVPNMYGEGNTITTLPNRTRLTSHQPQDYSKTLLCSGDSFTLGYGVDDTEAWCALMRKYGWNTINMGQGGYGIDQNYLWYERDAQDIPHQVHITAFTRYGYDRAQHDTFVGYERPYFVLEGGQLKNTRSELQPPFFLQRFLIKNAEALERLSIFRLLQRKSPPAPDLDTPQRRAVFAKILGVIDRLSKDRGAKHLYVIIPTGWDIEDRQAYSRYHEVIAQAAHTYDFPVLNIGEEMFAVEDERLNSFFIPEGELPYQGAAFHYTEAGNAFVAEAIARKLEALGW